MKEYKVDVRYVISIPRESLDRTYILHNIKYEVVKVTKSNIIPDDVLFENYLKVMTFASNTSDKILNAVMRFYSYTDEQITELKEKIDEFYVCECYYAYRRGGKRWLREFKPIESLTKFIYDDN
jgi:hypothetical protein